MAIDFTKYTKNKNDLEFLGELYDCFAVYQDPHILKCGNYSFQVDPGAGGATVWRYGKKIANFKTIDDLFLTFMIDGKPLIECISELEYDD